MCGVRGHACGPPTTVTGLDPMNAPMRGDSVGPLREYEVMANGIATTMQLSEEDARQLGLTQPTATPVTKARRVPNRARAPKDK